MPVAGLGTWLSSEAEADDMVDAALEAGIRLIDNSILYENEAAIGKTLRHGCQMAIARFLDRMCLALRASGLWLRYATLQNLIPSFPWIAPGWRAWGRNPRKGRDQTLQRSVAEPYSRSPKGQTHTI